MIPTLTPVAYCRASDVEEATRLSRALGLPLITKALTLNDISHLLTASQQAKPLSVINHGVQTQEKIVQLSDRFAQKRHYTTLLYLQGDTLTLFCHSPISQHPLALALDFTTPKMRNMAKQQNKKTLIAKAMGAKTRDATGWVVDATAGLGIDAFMLAYMGYKVTLIERSPVIAALLSHAINHVRPDSWAFSAIGRMTLLQADAAQWLSAQSQLPAATKKPTVIYLDPMFPHPDKKALSQKSMQMLQQVVGADQDADALLPLAQALATQRVVVKRHRASPYLGGQKPTLGFEGKSHRFDVYLSPK